MLFWKKRNATKNAHKETVTVDSTGKIIRKVRFGARKSTPPKQRVPPTNSTPPPPAP